MFDFTHQQRFLASATDAFQQYTEFALAASAAWQNAVMGSMNGGQGPAPQPVAPMPTDPIMAWSWALDMWRGPTAQPFQQPAAAAMMPWWANFGQPAKAAPAPANPFAMWMTPAAPPAFAAWMPPALAQPFASMMPQAPQPFAAWMAPQLPMAMPMQAATSLTSPAAAAEMWSAMVSAFWSQPAVSWSLYRGPWTMMFVGAGLPYAIVAPAVCASTSALDAADAVRLQTVEVFSAFRTDGGHASAFNDGRSPAANAFSPQVLH